MWQRPGGEHRGLRRPRAADLLSGALHQPRWHHGGPAAHGGVLLAKQGQAVDDVLTPLRENGFHVYRLANDYHPASHPTALRKPAVPVRWPGPVTETSDLVFSHTDAAYLA